MLFGRVIWILTLCAALGFGADAFYLGTWKIESAVIAPWWREHNPPDASESKTLVGKTFVVANGRISGPRQVACTAPRYVVKEYPADMLFQGSFGEMHERDKSVDPEKVAAKLGFRGSKWRTLETGCGNEVDFHFIDDTTATFGLNNYIYTLKKR